MKIAIPTANGKLCMHFGHCEVFSVFTTDSVTRTIVSQQELTPPPHEPGVLPRWLGKEKVNVIIAGGMGQRAQDLFAQQQITVITGAEADRPEALVQAFLENTLQTGQNACDH